MPQIVARCLGFALLLFPWWAVAQQGCTGSLGNNIFEAGDFGSGVPNILQPNPGIAPGYTYSSTLPPPDGSYVVTNNTGVWPNLHSTWLAIGDNSDDPNGYMMLVNAGFEPGLFYDQLVTGLCENTRYEFSADIINLIRQGVGGHISPNVTFLLDNVAQFSTGDIPQTNSWRTYGFTFETQPGQTELRLSLRNNAPGGIGNDLALDNISFRTCGDEAFILPDVPANICEDGQPLPLYATVSGDLFNTPAIQWQVSPNGFSNWTDLAGANDTVYYHSILAPGNYYYRFQLANGPVNLTNERCRINSNVKQVIVRPKAFSITDTICTGLTYAVGSSLYSTSGIYVDSLISSIGCDSIVTLNLTVLPTPNIQAGISTELPDCFNDPTGIITVNPISGGYPPYTVFLDSLLGNNANRFTGLVSNAFHQLLIIDRYGCFLDQQVWLPGPQILELDLGDDVTLELGETLITRPNTNFTVSEYAWTSDAGQEICPQPPCPTLEWVPITNQTLTLVATDGIGCTVVDSLQVTVIGNYEVYVPNAFSPNADGVNDRFTVFGPSPRLSEIASLRIYDRWGQLLFERLQFPPDDLGSGWDGKAKGRPMPQGTYVYVVEVRFLDGSLHLLTGDVTLLR